MRLSSSSCAIPIVRLLILSIGFLTFSGDLRPFALSESSSPKASRSWTALSSSPLRAFTDSSATERLLFFGLFESSPTPFRAL